MEKFIEENIIILSAITTIAALILPFLNKVANMLISSIGTLDVEKKFIPKNQCLLSEVFKALGYLLLIIYYLAIVSLLLYALELTFSAVDKYLSFDPLLYMLLILLVYLVLAVLLNYPAHRRKLLKSPKFRKYYPCFHSIVHVSWQFFLVLCGGTFVVKFADNSKSDNNIILLVILTLLCLLILFFHYLFFELRKKFLVAHYKIKKIKTKDGRIFTNLYLYSYNDRHVFLSYTPNPIESKEHLVINQEELIDCYELERECYYWDEKIEEEQYLLLNKAFLPLINTNKQENACL